MHDTGKAIASALVATTAMVVIGTGYAEAQPLAEQRVAAAVPQVARVASSPLPDALPKLVEAPAQKGWVSTRSGLNLRASATRDSARHHGLAYGTPVTILAAVEGQDPYHTGQKVWYKVSDQGQEGYIWAGRVTAGPAPVASPTPTAKKAVAKQKQPTSHRLKAKVKKVIPKKKSAKATSRQRVSVGGGWGALVNCESGGNPRAINPNGHYGLYQFSLTTWRSVGGTGNPVDASPAEQTQRAMALYNRSGAGQWSCGYHLK